jgi:hypothetical protein
MLRASVEGFLANPAGTRGCLLVQGAMNVTRANQAAHDRLREARLEGPDLIRKRIERGVREGELPGSVDARAVASFYTTVLHGLAIRARDGASRAALTAAVDGAMAAWAPLTSATVAGTARRSASSGRSRKAG